MRTSLLLLTLAACSGATPSTDTPTDGETGTDTDGPTETGLPTDTGTPPTSEACETLYDCTDGVCWVTLCGGTYEMGAAADAEADDDERPRHTVHIPTFELMETEVTVRMYSDCVALGNCVDIEDLPVAPPAGCLLQDRDDAQGCLDRQRAMDVCSFLGGRLPSEAEWEFAARSRGDDRTFPWGEEEPSCELAVLGYTDVPVWNCAEDGAARVCSRPAGNTDQGLCDMAGNIYEWVADPHHPTYDGAPDDGSVWDDPEQPFYVLRGGGLNSDEPVRTTNRTFHEPDFYYSGSGVRCARDPAQ